MIAKRCSPLLLFGITCGFAISAMAQDNEIFKSGSHKTVADALREYGIDLSEPSLVAALSDTRPKIRVLAAMELESNRDSDAIPSMDRALSIDQDPETRIGIATQRCR